MLKSSELQFLSAPNLLVWESTKRCNSRCVYCRNNAREGLENKEIKTNRIKKLVKELSEMKVFFLKFAAVSLYHGKIFLKFSD